MEKPPHNLGVRCHSPSQYWTHTTVLERLVHPLGGQWIKYPGFRLSWAHQDYLRVIYSLSNAQHVISHSITDLMLWISCGALWRKPRAPIMICLHSLSLCFCLVSLSPILFSPCFFSLGLRIFLATWKSKSLFPEELRIKDKRFHLG